MGSYKFKFIRRTTAALAASALLLAGVPVALAQGQAGSMRDAIAVYQQLLNDPYLDEGTRAQVREMIRLLEQEERDMRSAVPPMNSGYDNSYNYDPYANTYQDNSYVEEEEEEEEDYCNGCAVMRAD